jgi:hypothetical protein
MTTPEVLTVEHVWHEGWTVWKKHAWQAMLIVLPVYVLTLVFRILGIGVGLGAGHLNSYAPADIVALAAVLLLSAWIGVSLLVFYRDEGTPGAALRVGASLWPQYLLLGLMAALLIIGGTIVLVVPGIFLMVALCMTQFEFVWKGRRGLAALEGSRLLVQGHWWRVLGLIVVALVATIVVSAIAGIIGLIISVIGSSTFIYTIGTEFPNAVSALVLTPWVLAYLLGIYRGLQATAPAEPTAEELRKHRTQWIRFMVLAGVIIALLIVILALLH